MGKINVYAKWDLKENKWIMPRKELYGRCFAVAGYTGIINNISEKVNYIIIGAGTRVEDHSKDFSNINEKKLRIDTVINHYSRKNGNYCIRAFLMDADAPIIEDAKLLAEYVDALAVLPTTNSINIIGLSKSSDMNFYMPRFFKEMESFRKTNMFNIAPPYTGTRLASPLLFYPDVKKFIVSKLGDTMLASLVYNSLIKVYEGVSSNSHMDYDIAIPGGIPKEKYNFYDESFIKNIFSNENIQAIKNLNSFKNIITGIDKDTWKEAIRTGNFTGLGLCLLDDIFFENKSDGMVYVDAQREVENVLDIKSHVLKSTHHDVNSNTRAFREVLGIVDDTLEENEEKKIFYKSRNN